MAFPARCGGVLGALLGLEPGHSKTLMAAFIISVRGNGAQVTLLGLSATISHSLVIWTLAALALRYGNQWNVEATEPYLQTGTGLLVTGLALWALWKVRRDRTGHALHSHDEHKVLASKWGDIQLQICEEQQLAHFRATVPAAARATDLVVSIRRPTGEAQVFKLVPRGRGWQSLDPIPEPHDFLAEITVKSPDGIVSLGAHFSEEAGPHCDETPEDDAHAREHAADIRRRFDGRPVSASQIVLFRLTGGLMPCPAALSVLLVCLQLKRFTLGFSLVAAFSLGLAVTLVSVGMESRSQHKRATGPLQFPRPQRTLSVFRRVNLSRGVSFRSGYLSLPLTCWHRAKGTGCLLEL